MKSLSSYITRRKKYNPELDLFKHNVKRELISKNCNSFNDILYCEAEGSYSTIFTINGDKICISNNLKYLEKVLSKKDFARCHKSFLININHILDIIGPTPCIIILITGVRITVSCRKKRELFRLLGIRNN